jgi:hypothetical protein
MKSCFTPAIALTIVALCLSNLAHADESGKLKARLHFKQGVELFDQRRFGDALSEFQESYSLFPVYSTLYNIAQVQVVLGHPVEAADAFDKFLVQGGASIAREQRARVEVELKAQQERIGDIDVAVSPEGAEIQVDGAVVGKSPLGGSVRVASGHHRVDARLDGYRSEHDEVDVLGRGHVELTIQLQALQQMAAPLAAGPITSPLPPSPAQAPTPIPTASHSLPARDFNAGSTTHRSAQTIVGYSLVSIGLVTAGVGVGIGVDGQSKHSDAIKQWNASAEAQSRNNARQTESASVKEKTKGYVIMGAGGAALLAGTIVLLTAPSNQAGHARLNWSPWFGASAAGATLAGTW